MAKLFVVLGEAGEYSDREIWVSGIFTDEGMARRAIEAASAVRREHDQWHERYYSALKDDAWKAGRAYTDAEQAIAEAKAGPEPRFEKAQYFRYIEVPINEWGAFEEDWLKEARRRGGICQMKRERNEKGDYIDPFAFLPRKTNFARQMGFNNPDRDSGSRASHYRDAANRELDPREPLMPVAKAVALPKTSTVPLLTKATKKRQAEERAVEKAIGFDKKAYQKTYMREYQRRKRAEKRAAAKVADGR